MPLAAHCSYFAPLSVFVYAVYPVLSTASTFRFIRTYMHVSLCSLLIVMVFFSSLTSTVASVRYISRSWLIFTTVSLSSYSSQLVLVLQCVL